MERAMHNRADRDRRGFTLIELLVAIGAIALIAVG
ncbi:MAG: prepilin-type N-terminal cleavage/methylation domain-containing protein, partial [Phycisphaerales bacterium]|nr:prepilin-type N-terminal cleavage/methylation domain-containing protein [Phycisphaerales bacterium]